MAQGTYGKIRLFDAFLSVPTSGSNNHYTWGSAIAKIGSFGLFSVNEGSWAATIDEPGGVVAITTDTADNDNAAIVAGTFQPADGTITMEARFKIGHLTGAVFVGFTETLATGTPVMPAEFASTTMTYNGSGGMVGFNYDSDGTADDFRAVGGDGGSASGNADTNGTRANQTITADEWYVAKVEIYEDGKAAAWIAHDDDRGAFELVKRFDTAPVTAGDNFYATLMIENRDGNARVLEVDYIDVTAGRDWSND